MSVLAVPLEKKHKIFKPESKNFTFFSYLLFDYNLEKHFNKAHKKSDF
jgi:hypothetical protein